MPMLDAQGISQLAPQTKLMLIEERLRTDHRLRKDEDYAFTFNRGRVNVLCEEEQLDKVRAIFSHYQIDVEMFHTYK